MNSIDGIFEDNNIIAKIREKLPVLFQMAELESSRAGKLGMEVGSVRERILIALLKHTFGDDNVNATSPITEAETDVLLFKNPISIKTVSGKTLNGVKLIWTVDAQKAKFFALNYKPSCDLILVQIYWENEGSLFFIPKNVQIKVLNKIGRDAYIKLPKEGTNPRGVELSKEALALLTSDATTKRIKIDWTRSNSEHDIYKKWIELWD